MSIDRERIEKLWRDEKLSEYETFSVEGVSVEMPIGYRKNKDIHRQWQRRVFDDIMPDSPNADASEKIPFRILRNLTVNQGTACALEDTFESPFSALKPVFWRGTVPISFHVLAACGAAKTIESRVFSERTFLLLMRDQNGRINEPLLKEFLGRFRRPPQELDLAQNYVLDQIQPGWNPETEFGVDYQNFIAPIPPFMQDAAGVFQRDIKTLLDANLPAADHFQYVNTLLALHLGLYMPRLALRLNQSIKMLADALVEPDCVDVDVFKQVESGRHSSTRFEGRLSLRAPIVGQQRKVALNSSEHTSYEEMSRELGRLHFSLMLFHRLRELSKSYILSTEGEKTPDELQELVRWPSDIAIRLQTDTKFRQYLAHALEVLCVRYVKEQLRDNHQIRGRKSFETMTNGLDGLRECYQIYNLQPVSGGSKSRAVAQGIRVVEGLLKHSEHGIIQSRKGVGSYFELGMGLIPLLLLLAMGNKREKIQVADFWRALSKYGFRFERDEQEKLLSRLKSMGLYERFSDAGEASYIRNLLVGNAS